MKKWNKREFCLWIKFLRINKERKMLLFGKDHLKCQFIIYRPETHLPLILLKRLQNWKEVKEPIKKLSISLSHAMSLLTLLSIKKHSPSSIQELSAIITSLQKKNYNSLRHKQWKPNFLPSKVFYFLDRQILANDGSTHHHQQSNKEDQVLFRISLYVDSLPIGRAPLLCGSRS